MFDVRLDEDDASGPHGLILFFHAQDRPPADDVVKLVLATRRV